MFRAATGRCLGACVSGVLLGVSLSACGSRGVDPVPPATGSAAAPSSGCGRPAVAGEVLARVNEFRSTPRSCGSKGRFTAAAPLAWDDRLAAAAAAHSGDMAKRNYFSHTGPGGRQLQDRLGAAGYTWHAIGENIAAGQDSVAAAMASWQASPGHCANLMNPVFTQVGLACASREAAGGYGIYWTMVLAKP